MAGKRRARGKEGGKAGVLKGRSEREGACGCRKLQSEDAEKMCASANGTLSLCADVCVSYVAQALLVREERVWRACAFRQAKLPLNTWYSHRDIHVARLPADHAALPAACSLQPAADSLLSLRRSRHALCNAAARMAASRWLELLPPLLPARLVPAMASAHASSAAPPVQRHARRQAHACVCRSSICNAE